MVNYVDKMITAISLPVIHWILNLKQKGVLCNNVGANAIFSLRNPKHSKKNLRKGINIYLT